MSIIEDDDIIDAHKSQMIARAFFADDIPDCDWSEALCEFITCGAENGEESSQKTFDYDEDAEEIFSSFVSVYGINLFDSDMHWWEFYAMFKSLFRCECPLSEKIKIRTLDISKCGDKAAASKAKAAVALSKKRNADDFILELEIERRLNNGESISDLIGG